MYSDRGFIHIAVVVGIAAVLTTGAVVAGTMMTSSSDEPHPDPNELLAGAEDTYSDADTVLIDATITADHEYGDRQQVDVSLASGEANQSRVAVAGESGSIVAGTTADAKWIEIPDIGLAAVAENGSVSVSPQAAFFETAFATEHPDMSSIETLGSAVPVLSDQDTDDIELPQQDIIDAANSSEDWHHPLNRSLTDVAAVEYVETTTVRETESHLISVTPDQNETTTELRLWITADDNRIIQQQIETNNGNITTTVTDQELNTDISNSTFEPPQSDFIGDIQTVTTHEELQSVTDGDTAVLDASAFEFETGSVTDIVGTTAVVSQYSGLANVTVIQSAQLESLPIDGEQRMIGNQSVTVGTIQNESIAVWNQDGTPVGVLGAETTEELEAVVSATRIE